MRLHAAYLSGPHPRTNVLACRGRLWQGLALGARNRQSKRREDVDDRRVVEGIGGRPRDNLAFRRLDRDELGPEILRDVELNRNAEQMPEDHKGKLTDAQSNDVCMRVLRIAGTAFHRPDDMGGDTTK